MALSTRGTRALARAQLRELTPEQRSAVLLAAGDNPQRQIAIIAQSREVWRGEPQTDPNSHAERVRDPFGAMMRRAEQEARRFQPAPLSEAEVAAAEQYEQTKDRNPFAAARMMHENGGPILRGLEALRAVDAADVAEIRAVDEPARVAAAQAREAARQVNPFAVAAHGNPNDKPPPTAA